MDPEEGTLQKKEVTLNDLGIGIAYEGESHTTPMIRFVYDKDNNKAVRFFSPKMYTPKDEEFDINSLLEDPVNLATLVLAHMMSEGQPWGPDVAHKNHSHHPLVEYLKSDIRKNEKRYIKAPFRTDDPDSRRQINLDKERGARDKKFSELKKSWPRRLLEEEHQNAIKAAIREADPELRKLKMQRAVTKPHDYGYDILIKPDPTEEDDLTASPNGQFELIAQSDGKIRTSLYTDRGNPRKHKLVVETLDPELARKRENSIMMRVWEDPES